MMLGLIGLAIPNALWLVPLLLASVFAIVIVYALIAKQEVRAEFSHGSTSFRLEASDRRRKRLSGKLNKLPHAK
jgi:hypothetical protein